MSISAKRENQPLQSIKGGQRDAVPASELVELGSKSGQGKDTDREFTDSPAPEGGLESWLVAAEGFSILFSCLGFSNSFGALAEYYLTHQLSNETSDKVAWIGSVSAFIQFATGMVGGPLFDRFGARVVYPTAVVYVLAMMMLSLCNEYWQFMLVQGPLMGITSGFLQFPAIAAVSQYFERKRGAALGVVVSGSSVGGIILPILISKTVRGVVWQ